MSSTIALILHIDCASAVEAMANCMPVWIASSEAHRDVKRLLESQDHPPPLTWFPIREGESLEAAAIRISFSLDDHYNEDVQKVGYKFLLAFGVKCQTSMEADLAELGFRSVESTSFGFCAKK